MDKMYWVDPTDLKFDEDIRKFNPPKSTCEFNSLYDSINQIGQQDPVLMRRGLVGEGYNRTKIAKMLGRNVLVKEVDSSMDDKTYIALCNTNTFTARNPTATQKAIRAYDLTKTYGFTDVEALRTTGMNIASKVIGYVRTIDASQYNKKHNILADLSEDKTVCINGKYTKSIDVAKREIKKMEESSVVKDVDEDLVSPEIDYNGMVISEAARDKFWNYYKKTDIEKCIEHIKYLNYVYKGVESEEG